MEPQTSSPNNYLKTVKILHLALFAGQILFLGFSVLINFKGGILMDDISLKEVFLYIVLALALVGVVGGHLFFKSRLAIAKHKKSLTEKLSVYRSALIISCAILEVPFLLAVISYLLTGSRIFPGIGIVLLVMFLLLRPSKEKISDDLELDPDESNKLETIEIV